MSSIPSSQLSLPFDGKRCSRCRQFKPLTEFHQRRTAPDGRTHDCRSCVRTRGIERRARMSAAEYEAHRASERARVTEYRRRIGTEVLEDRARERRLAARSTPEEKVRLQLRAAVREKRVVKPDRCQQCGQETDAPLLHGHHEDYRKPLEVVWLCPVCHGRTWRKYG